MSNLRVGICSRYQLYCFLEATKNHLLFTGYNLHSHQKLFIKGESRRHRPFHHQYSIPKESKVYQSIQGGPGVPALHWCGQDGDYNFLIIQQLSQENLQQLFQKSNRKLSIKTIVQIGLSVLQTLIYLHIKGMVHNRVDPTHIIPGVSSNSHKLYLIDYSQASCFKDPKTGELLPRKGKDSFHANEIFSSVNVHEGFSSSRKDDLESWIYMLIYLFKGNLPWMDKQRDRIQMLIKKKQTIANKTWVSDLPEEIRLILRHIKNLQFQSQPDYQYLKDLLNRLAHRQYLILDDIYDWMLTDRKKDQSKPQGTYQDVLINLEVINNQREFLEDQYLICQKEQEEMNNMSHLLSQTINGEFQHMETAWVEPETVEVECKKKECLLF